MKVGFFHVKNEHGEAELSMGRLQVFIGTCLGIVIAILGAIHAAFLGGSSAIMIAGIGLVAGDGAIKGVQKIGEKK